MNINFNLKDLKNGRVVLFGGLVLLLIITLVFFAVLPLVHSIRLNSAAVKNQKAILNYVLKYSAKIDSMKSEEAVLRISPVPLMLPTAAASGKIVGNFHNKSYIKFISSLLRYFKINKKQISKLYSRYSSDEKGGGSGSTSGSGGLEGKTSAASASGAGGASHSNETIFVSLKSLSLNQSVNIIYALSNSSAEYGTHIVSINLKKNFTNDKLLDLTIDIVRKANY